MRATRESHRRYSCPSAAGAAPALPPVPSAPLPIADSSAPALARDLGFGYAEAESWMESVGEFIDYMKIRHLWVLLMSEQPDDLVRRKIQLYRKNNIEVNPGGIVFEMAYLSNAVEKTFETLVRLGFTAVECSENIIPLTLDEKVKYVKMAKGFGLKVLFEVGDKYPEDKFDAALAASEIATYDSLRRRHGDRLPEQDGAGLPLSVQRASA